MSRPVSIFVDFCGFGAQGGGGDAVRENNYDNIPEEAGNAADISALGDFLVAPACWLLNNLILTFSNAHSLPHLQQLLCISIK